MKLNDKYSELRRCLQKKIEFRPLGKILHTIIKCHSYEAFLWDKLSGALKKGQLGPGMKFFIKIKLKCFLRNVFIWQRIQLVIIIRSSTQINIYEGKMHISNWSDKKSFITGCIINNNFDYWYWNGRTMLFGRFLFLLTQ